MKDTNNTDTNGVDITKIQAKDLHFFNISADNNIIYVEYSGGYQDSYYNILEIDLKNNTYISKIKDPNKNELAKVFNKIYSKQKFDFESYKKYSIIELWENISRGVDKVCLRIDPGNGIYKNIQNYINVIGHAQINNLAQEYNDVDNSILNKLIEHYYLLYLQYGYQLFRPFTLSIENSTGYNKIYDDFYSMIAKNDSYDPEDFILEKPDNELIMKYLLFAQSFVFQFTNDLKNIFFE